MTEAFSLSSCVFAFAVVRFDQPRAVRRVVEVRRGRRGMPNVFLPVFDVSRWTLNGENGSLSAGGGVGTSTLALRWSSWRSKCLRCETTGGLMLACPRCFSGDAVERAFRRDMATPLTRFVAAHDRKGLKQPASWLFQVEVELTSRMNDMRAKDPQ